MSTEPPKDDKKAKARPGLFTRLIVFLFGGNPDSTGETLRTLALAIFVALVFRSFAYEPFHIPSGSMKSNLLIGDYIFISKFSYGYSKYSFPFGVFPFKGRIFHKHEPARGDVIVFRPPGDPSVDFIKRLIGMPNDRIQMKDGVLYINDKPVQREFVDEWTDYDTRPPVVLKRYKETLPEGKSYIASYQPEMTAADNTEVFTVPEGHYFMMGDNRDNSQDSRFAKPVGYVPLDNLVGRADLIFFSWSCGYPFCAGRNLLVIP